MRSRLEYVKLDLGITKKKKINNKKHSPSHATLLQSTSSLRSHALGRPTWPGV